MTDKTYVVERVRLGLTEKLGKKHCTNISRQYQLPSSSLAFNTVQVCSLQEYTANSGILTQELQSNVVHTLVKMKGTTIPVANDTHE
jgi:hypothetical protein